MTFLLYVSVKTSGRKILYFINFMVHELPGGDGHVECGEDDGGNYECQTARVEHIAGRFGPDRWHTLLWVPATITR
jgi:hypothetical protein